MAVQPDAMSFQALVRQDAQWFSVSVAGQCIRRNPVEIKNYLSAFCSFKKENVLYYIVP